MEKELIELTFDSVADGIITTDTDGIIIGLNNAAKKMLGVTHETAIDKPIDEVFSLLDKNTKKTVQGLWKEALTFEKKVGLYRNVVLVNTKGHQCYVSATFSVIQKQNQAPCGVVVIFRDVSLHRENEEKLYLFQLALEQSPNAVVITDKDNLIVYVNRRFTLITEYSSDEVIGNDPGFLKSGSTPIKKYDQLWEALEAGKVWTGEFFNRKKNGQFYWERAVISPIRDSQGNTTHYLAIKEDITLQKSMEDELRRTRQMAENNLEKSHYYMKQLEKARQHADRLNRSKSEFLASMSHEIRTPLNGLMGMISLLEISPLNEEQKDHLEVIRICGDNLLNVINNVMDFSKIESGKMELDNVSFDPADWMAKAMSVHQVQADKKGIKLLWVVDPQLPEKLSGDSKHLQQILNNLVGNAIKFTDHGWVIATVEPLVREEQKVWVEIKVSDTGMGIPEDEIPRLFDSFTQLDRSITRRFGGTGLGLSITRQLVELMGGTIEVSSRIGKGSEFSVSIPFSLVDENGCEEYEPDKNQLSEKETNDKKILVAEDDAINRTVIRSILTAKKYEIVLAMDGDEAVEKWKSEKPDAILMDIQMPFVNGMEATRRIREEEKADGDYTPIIALTAHAIHGDRERFLGNGMDDYVAKPIDMEHLFSAIDRVLKPGFKPDAPAGDYVNQAANAMETTDDFIKKMFHLMDELESAIDVMKFQEIENLSQEIKRVSLTAGELDIKNRVFKILLASRKRDSLEIVKAFAALKRSYKAYLNFAGQKKEWEQKGGDEV